MSKCLFASLVIVVMMVSGCSSSGDGGASSGTNGSDTDTARLARAEAATKKNLQAPTTIPLTEPLKSKPPTGKTFVYMKCRLDQCRVQAEATMQATAALGWTYKEVPFDETNPATLVSGMKQALAYKPVAVGVPGQPEAVWQSVIPAYRAAKVSIVTNFVGPMEYDDTVIGQAGGIDNVKWGEMIANWAIADSNGHANVLLETVNTYPVAKAFSDSYANTMKENCSSCSVTVLDNTIPQVFGGKVNDTIVAALQRDPTINYVATANGPLISGLDSALAAAGMSNRVKISGESADVSNLTNVKAGKEHAFTAAALGYGQWLMIDMVLRHMQGMSYEEYGDGGLPTQLLTKDVEFDVAASYERPADWQDQMKKLWHVE